MHISWNKGQTKETNASLKQASETLKQRYANGEITPSFQGKHHTEETKRKISESSKKRKLYIYKFRSNNITPTEQKIIDILNKIGIKYEHNYIVHYHENTLNRRYQYDVAIVNLLIDIETDGWEHTLQKRIESDKLRDYLSNKYGWIVVRIKNEELKNMSDAQIENFLLKIIKTAKQSIQNRKNLWNSNPWFDWNQKQIEKKIKKQKFEKTKEKRIQLILNSNIDFNVWGWSKQVAQLIGITSRAAARFIKKYMPKLYEKCKIHHIKSKQL